MNGAGEKKSKVKRFCDRFGVTRYQATPSISHRHTINTNGTIWGRLLLTASLGLQNMKWLDYLLRKDRILGSDCWWWPAPADKACLVVIDHFNGKDQSRGEMSASLPGSRPLPDSRYDLSTYWGRVRHAASIADMRSVNPWSWCHAKIYRVSIGRHNLYTSGHVQSQG